jgi:hypothetical protein
VFWPISPALGRVRPARRGIDPATRFGAGIADGDGRAAPAPDMARFLAGWLVGLKGRRPGRVDPGAVVQPIKGIMSGRLPKVEPLSWALKESGLGR